MTTTLIIVIAVVAIFAFNELYSKIKELEDKLESIEMDIDEIKKGPEEDEEITGWEAIERAEREMADK